MLNRRRTRHWLGGISAFVVVAVAVGTLVTLSHGAAPVRAASGSATTGRSLAPDTQFFVPNPADLGALQQIADLRSHQQQSAADQIQQMIQTPQAVWFTSGGPKDVQQSVKQVVQEASGKGTVPVLVAYDVPGRDCAQYSAGGAATGDDYKAWIDGFAAGLGS